MTEYVTKPESRSNMSAHVPNAARQAAMSEVLQQYKNRALSQHIYQRIKDKQSAPLQGMFNTVQRTETDEEEPLQGKFSDTVQRVDEGEESLQGKFTNTIQREGSDEEEEPLQGKFDTVQREKKTNNTGLPDNLKNGVESLSGFSFDNVHVHYNSSKPATVQALAYTQGTDIHVAPGQEQHLPHEAWHVAQQMAGRVQPTTEVGGMPVNDNVGLEHEADVMGARALNV